VCVIIDANVAPLIFFPSCENDFSLVLIWLLECDGCLVTGGKLTRELNKHNNINRFIKELSRSGKARIIPDRELEIEEKRICDQIKLCSNDPHIIALARISGARTLCSRDRELHKDFKNKLLVDNPRGRIYENSAHKDLLTHTPSCKGGKRN
jgi:hypothetical protein